jgi:hypothetical protein
VAPLQLCLFIISKSSSSLSEQVGGLAESPLANALVDLSLCLLIAQDHVCPLKQEMQVALQVRGFTFRVQ